MKAKAFLEKINKQGKINNEDFNKALETFTDAQEIPDLWVNLFEENFLTRERASSDFDIVKKIKAETLNGVDERLKDILPLLDPTDREALEKETNTFKKVEGLKNAIPKLLEKIQGANPSTDEKVKQLEKNNSELVDKIKSINSEAEAKQKDLQKQFEASVSGMKLDWTLDKKFAGYTFADEFTGVKDAIIKGIITDVKGKNSLQLNDKGELVVVEVDPSTQVAKPKFNGNDPVTIDSLLAEPLKPFLKKNNAGDGKGTQTTQTQTRTNTRETATTHQASGNPTLAERRMGAKQNAPVQQS